MSAHARGGKLAASVSRGSTRPELWQFEGRPSGNALFFIVCATHVAMKPRRTCEATCKRRQTLHARAEQRAKGGKPCASCDETVAHVHSDLQGQPTLGNQPCCRTCMVRLLCHPWPTSMWKRRTGGRGEAEAQSATSRSAYATINHRIGNTLQQGCPTAERSKRRLRDCVVETRHGLWAVIAAHLIRNSARAPCIDRGVVCKVCSLGLGVYACGLRV